MISSISAANIDSEVKKVLVAIIDEVASIREEMTAAVARLSGDTPATDAPVVDAPVVDAPVIDAPVIDAPAIDAPDAPEQSPAA
jgi:ribonuclease E